jgi:hypothetical protein
VKVQCVTHFLLFERIHKTLHNAFAEFLTKGTVNVTRGVMTVDRNGNDQICRTARDTLSAAANCAVIASANGGSGQVRTESRVGDFQPKTVRLGAIREVLIRPWSV